MRKPGPPNGGRAFELLCAGYSAEPYMRSPASPRPGTM